MNVVDEPAAETMTVEQMLGILRQERQNRFRELTAKGSLTIMEAEEFCALADEFEPRPKIVGQMTVAEAQEAGYDF